MIEFALLVFVWPLCVILAPVIAWSKGRSGCSFAILAVLFGPLAVLASMIVSPDPEIKIRKGLASGKLVRCVWCREPVHLDAAVCPHCQRDNP
ncbi:hypothetical protein [Novosphingobium sp. B1]|uniref:hypothetical protein n=1 Tax=Novosphingobium sp. B1 TaxID=1938756 RepID=UPI0009D85F0E|nr:hypothetical protein [Novosphingobium sp. B1]SMC84317.1 hypothetical protein SAMN06272759_108179 [Novosphingobium sp. B1]